MEKKSVGLMSQPIAPYFFGLYFVIYQSSNSFSSFILADAFLFIIIYCLVIGLIITLLAKLFLLRNTTISILVFAILFLFSDYFRYEIKNQLSIFSFRNRQYSVYLFFFIALLVYIEHKIMLRNKGLNRIINKWCNLFLFFLMLIDLGNGIYNNYREHTMDGRTGRLIKKDIGIVWILMDQYPSTASLQQYFNYTDPLDSFLIGKHFILLETIKSRYGATLFSLNSIFNYDDSIRPKSFASSIHRLQRSKWIADIDYNDEKFLNLDFLTIGDHGKLMDLFYFPDTYGKQLLYGSLFFNAVVAQKTMEVDQYNTSVNKSLDSVLRKDPDRYKLIWAHFLIPHMPYFRNRHGELLKNNGEAHEAATAKSEYIEYLEYGNTLIEALLKEHPVLQNKIVIISGDHGVRFPFVKKADWKKPYFAIHYPSAFDTASLKKIKYISQLPDWLAKQ